MRIITLCDWVSIMRNDKRVMRDDRVGLWAVSYERRTRALGVMPKRRRNAVEKLLVWP